MTAWGSTYSTHPSSTAQWPQEEEGALCGRPTMLQSPLGRAVGRGEQHWSHRMYIPREPPLWWELTLSAIKESRREEKLRTPGLKKRFQSNSFKGLFIFILRRHLNLSDTVNHFFFQIWQCFSTLSSSRGLTEMKGKLFSSHMGWEIIERTNLVRVTYLNALLSPFFLMWLFSICLLLWWTCRDQINFK